MWCEVVIGRSERRSKFWPQKNHLVWCCLNIVLLLSCYYYVKQRKKSIHRSISLAQICSRYFQVEIFLPFYYGFSSTNESESWILRRKPTRDLARRWKTKMNDWPLMKNDRILQISSIHTHTRNESVCWNFMRNMNEQRENNVEKDKKKQQ